MEFLDNTGHIFSLPTYNELPIGYDYEEQPYIFWIDALYTDKLSIDNCYAKVINALIKIDHEENIDEYYINKRYDIDIQIENSNIFSLLKPVELNNIIEEVDNVKEYIEIIRYDQNSESYTKNISTNHLTNDDLLIVRTTESYNDEQYDFLLIPIYVLSNSTTVGTWISNILIHVKDNDTLEETWTPISIGGEYDNECEELVINGQNMGINLPKGILKAIYQTSYINAKFDATLYNQKLKEYLFNYMNLKGEFGNFDSTINGLKWFGYGNRLSITKLLQTDNQFKEQYLHKHFDILYNTLNSFKTFRNTTYITIQLALYKELEETYPFEFDKDLFGENKPKLESLLDKYVKVNVGHDLDIVNEDGKTMSEKLIDREKYWYWKPYFDFTFNELGLKLACLKYFYEKYFLPIHLSIHSISTTHKVFANDIKFTVGREQQAITEHIETIWTDKDDVKFLGNGTHYFTKQIHWLDQFFNEYNFINDKYEDSFYLNDTCTNIPIKFINNENNKGYFNCVMLLERRNSSNTKYEYYLYENISDIINDYLINKNILFNIQNISNINNLYFSYTDNIDNKDKKLNNYSLYIKGIPNLASNIIEKYKNDYIVNNSEDDIITTLSDLDIFKILYKFEYIDKLTNKRYYICMNLSDINITMKNIEDIIYNYIHKIVERKYFLNKEMYNQNIDRYEASKQIKHIDETISILNSITDIFIEQKSQNRKVNNIYKLDKNDRIIYNFTDNYKSINIVNKNDDVLYELIETNKGTYKSKNNNDNNEYRIIYKLNDKIKIINMNTDNSFKIGDTKYFVHLNGNDYQDIVNSLIEQDNKIEISIFSNIYIRFITDTLNIGDIVLPNKIYDISNIEYYIKHDSTLIYESHFNFYQDKNNVFQNFVIYPKMLNIDSEYNTRYINYWINSNYILHLLVNNKWYKYNFTIQLPEPDIDLGKIRYKYWLNDNNYILNNIIRFDNNDNNEHILAFVYNNTYFIIKNADIDNYYVFRKESNDLSEIDEKDIHELFEKDIQFYLSDISKTSLLYKYIDIVNKNQLMDYIYNMSSCYISNFNQILSIDGDENDKRITFNSFMHHPEFVEVNNINWDVDVLFRTLKYNFDNNIHFIDQTIIDNNEFYYYIELYNNGKYQKIYIHKENIGYNIRVPETEFDNDILYILKQRNFTFILSENGENNENYLMLNGYFMSTEDDLYDDEVVVDEYDNYVTGIELDSSSYVEFKYNKDKNCYTNNGIDYYLKESLHYNLEHIFKSYNLDVNVHNNNKYFNSLHIFDLYKKITHKENILIFHNDIDMTANGLIFHHDKYNQYDPDSVKFDLYGLVYPNTLYNENGEEIMNPNIQTSSDKTIDNYSLGWNKEEDLLRDDNQENNIYPDKKIYPFIEEIKNNIYVYYKKYDSKNKAIITKDEAKNKYFEYTLDKFTDWKKNTSTVLGYDIFENVDAFEKYWTNKLYRNTYIKKYRKFDNIEIKKLTGKDNIIYDIFGDPIKENDLYITIRNHNFKVEYQFEYVTIENDKITNYDPTIIEYMNNEPKQYKLKVNYRYYDIVRIDNVEIQYAGNYNKIFKEIVDGETKYYFLYKINKNASYDESNDEYKNVITDEEISNYINNGVQVDENGIKIQKIYLKQLKTVQYIDKRPSKDKSFIVRNQNPAMYWFNIEKDDFEELDRTLNILNRYWGEYDEDSSTLMEDKYHFKNYLMKDITGLSGKFELFYKVSSGCPLRVVVAITLEDGTTKLINDIENQNDVNSKLTENIETGFYESTPIEFELTGNEKEVIVFFQGNVDDNNKLFTEQQNIEIYPYIYKVYDKYEKIDYKFDEYEDEEYLEYTFNNTTYKYGYNRSQNIVKLYEDFFEERFTIYDIMYNKESEDDKILTNSSVLALSDKSHIKKINKIRSLYRSKIDLNINFDYDFYLMHDDKQWYGIFISQNTINNANSEDDIILKDSDKEIYFKSKDGKTDYMLKFIKSDKQFLINRMEYVTSYPKYHFNADDIIVSRMLNNDRLPVNINLGSKWNIKPLSIGMTKDTEFESNSEMTIISLPMNDNEYVRGYYKIDLQYSLDRDIQHQNKKSMTFRVN